MKTVSAVVIFVLSASASAFVVPAAKPPLECECIRCVVPTAIYIRSAHHRDVNSTLYAFFLSTPSLRPSIFRHLISDSLCFVFGTLPPFPPHEIKRQRRRQLVSSTLLLHPRGGSIRRSIWIRPRSRRWTSSRPGTRRCTAAVGNPVRSHCATLLTWLTIRRRGTTSVR